MTPFQLSKVSTLKPEVDGNGMACVSITRTTLGQLFHAQGNAATAIMSWRQRSAFS